MSKSDSLEHAVLALEKRASREPIPNSLLNKFSGLLDSDRFVLNRWNTFGGSQNFSPIAHAAIGDVEYLVELTDVWKKEGLFGTEFGSNGFYTYKVIQALCVALHETANESYREKLQNALRAIWTFIALCSLKVNRSSTELFFYDKTFLYTGIQASYKNGVTTAIAGNRQNPTHLQNNDFLGFYLSWALGINDRIGPSYKYFRKDIFVSLNNTYHVNKPVKNYSEYIKPYVFGLTNWDVFGLIEIILYSNYQHESAKSLIKNLNEFGILRNWKYEIEKWVDSFTGVTTIQSIFYGPYPNSNKPPFGLVRNNSLGKYQAYSPFPAKKSHLLISGYQVTKYSDHVSVGNHSYDYPSYIIYNPPGKLVQTIFL